ncbi:MAG: response regulator [Candidatus Sulfotelmatobacter sp.]
METLRQQRILIVDNDERVLRVIDGFLANAGFDTRTASDGHSALDLLKLQECDLVFVSDHLSDYFLDGFLKDLQHLPTQPSVIVMQSDRPRSWEVGPYRQLGASGAVNKARPCEVLDAANEVLCSSRLR